MELQIIVKYSYTEGKEHLISVTPIKILKDFTTHIGDTFDQKIADIDHTKPIINSHQSIKSDALLARIPNFRMRYSTFEIDENLKSFSVDVLSSPLVFLSKPTNKETNILSEGIIFESSSKLFFTNSKGKSYIIKDYKMCVVSPGSFVINTTNFNVTGTYRLDQKFGFQLMTYLQRLSYSWAIPPIQSLIKHSSLIPRITVLLTKPMEEVANWLLSLKDGMTTKEFISAMDSVDLFSPYYRVRTDLKLKVSSLTFPTSYKVLLADFNHDDVLLAEYILLLEVDFFNNLNPHLILA